MFCLEIQDDILILNCETILKYAEWLDFRSKFFLTIDNFTIRLSSRI